MKLIALQGRLNLGTEEAPDFPVKRPSAGLPAAAVTNRAACFRGYCKPRQGRVRWPGTVPPMSQRLLQQHGFRIRQLSSQESGSVF